MIYFKSIKIFKEKSNKKSNNSKKAHLVKEKEKNKVILIWKYENKQLSTYLTQSLIKKLPHSYSIVLRSRRQILFVRRKCKAIDSIRVAYESFNAFSTRYPPHSDSIVLRSRRQILSIWWKCKAIDSIRVACEGFNTFSTRYPPHSDSIVLRSRRQILSIWWKYYVCDLVWGIFEGLIRSPLDTLHTLII